MREPRPRQRLPEGGLDIFEKRKAGTWQKTLLIFAQPSNWHPPLAKPRTRDEYLANGYTVLYEPHFDPMLYFWPVDGCQFMIRADSVDTDITTRLVRAGLRDGAELVVVNVATPLTTYTRFHDHKSGWKKFSFDFEHDVVPPSKKTRYEMTLALIKQADREAMR